MKIALNLICLILSLNVFGQSVDTARKETAKPLMIVDAQPINNHDKPLYVVDGIIFKGNIKKINPNDIKKVYVLKPPGSTNIYGKQGKYSVILITTKYQRIADTIKEKPISLVIAADTSYVIDGILSTDKLNKISPADILSINVLKIAPGLDKSLATPIR